MNHLGHESRAIHAAYAGGAMVATLPLEFYEAQKLKNVVQFTTAADDGERLEPLQRAVSSTGA